MADDYDFIVVGTGSAGSAIASRLTENPNVSVLALEAGGPDVPDAVHNPSIWFTLLGSEIDWGYMSVGQRGLNGRPTYEPRGKLPGGSSNLYIMMHIRGNPADFDNWAYNGCPGWSYEECIPYFQKLEDQEDDTNPTAGHGGALAVTNAGEHNPNPASQAFLDACAELGYPSTPDFNAQHLGAGWHHINVKDHKRFSTPEGYLQPAAGRPNFTLSTNSYATRLLFSRNRCTGVEYVQDGVTKTANAGSEVIVSCGAIESPHLLLLSGIGPEGHLNEFAIPKHTVLPGVGQNFHNHVLTGIINESPQPVPPGYQNCSEVALFTKSDAGWPAPDIQIAFVHVPFDVIVGQQHPNATSILPGVVRPLSRGSIRLLSADPSTRPLVDPNYLGVAADLDRLVQATEIGREIYATSAFKPWVKNELLPGPGVKTKEDLRDFVRARADSYHHQAGSCKMGMDDMAVVDPQLRVHGVEGLRVADASVMPAVPSGNCHAAIVMIAERLADMLKTEHGVH